MMSVHPRVLGFLGRALSHEMTAVQQYMTLAAVCRRQGWMQAAQAFDQEAAGELEHARRITERLIACGALPARSQLQPARIGSGLHALLEEAADLERRAVELYEEAAVFAARIGDADSQAFFSGLLEEEVAHLRELENWQANASGQFTTTGAMR